MVEKITSQIRGLLSALAHSVASEEKSVYIILDAVNLTAASRLLSEKFSLRLASSVATDDREGKNCFTLRYIFAVDLSPVFIVLETAIRPDGCSYDSITPLIPSAHLFERENFEFFGLFPRGHPDLKRALLHDDWPANLFPLRKDFAWDTKAERKIDVPYDFLRIEGEGVFEVPVGPVHAGIIEPGHFRFSAAGEPIINLEIRLGYVHKGIEKLAEGKGCADALKLAERVSGDASFAHSLAFCHAVENILQVDAPKRAKVIRTVFAEMERIYCHLGDIAGIATDVGFAFGSMQMLRLRETSLRMNFELSGHRLLRGVNVPGGVSLDIGPKKLEGLLVFLSDLISDFGSIEQIFLESDSLMDRVEGTGKISARLVKDLGGVGPAARAAGVDIDLRRDYPYDDYDSVQFEVPVMQEGDVAARMAVKMAEIKQSVHIIRRSLERLDETPLLAPFPRQLKTREAFGWAESARGEIMHWLRVDPQGIIERLKIKSPSFVNWPLLSWAVRGNIIPDFPLINKSFNLSYSGNDR